MSSCARCKGTKRVLINGIWKECQGCSSSALPNGELTMHVAADCPSERLVSNRTLSIALMFAEIHINDGDCLGDAARELHAALVGKVDTPIDFDC